MNNGMDTRMETKTINQLIEGIDGKKICFVVPSYQRGYRWAENEISKLLTDLYEFKEESAVKGNRVVGEYYCLQPIVVKKMINEEVSEKLGREYSIENNTDYYEIVDGQQRMITIYILLKRISQDIEPYSIEFERDLGKERERHNLISSILSNPEWEIDIKNVKCADVHYFYEALKSIDNWLKKCKERSGKSNIKSYMTNVLCDDTKVIWYELENTEDCYSVFKNINHGKIPLTDAELVKAMLLNSKYLAVGEDANEKITKQEQDHYARLWDEIQRELCDTRMWGFITGGGRIDLPTNIDFLIQLVVKKKSNESLPDTDYKFFSYFEKEISTIKNTEERKTYIKQCFEMLRKSFRTIQDWYNNYMLHNYIGYILTYSGRGVDSRIDIIIQLMEKYEKETKKDFIEKILKTEYIKKMFEGLEKEEINYDDNRKAVEKLLMLFNIEELNKIHMKFNFNVDESGWSVEHIKAQHSEIVETDKRKDYLNKERELLSKLKDRIVDSSEICKVDSILKKIESLVNSTEIDDTIFKSIAELIDRDIDGFDAEDMHKLGNLALISKKDNSELNNDPFYQKREKIYKWINDPDKNIPNSTQKAFSKMYSTQEFALDFTRWRKNDFDNMFECQKQMLKDYIEV